MRERARSQDDKRQRSEDLLDAAETLAKELNGVQHLTVGAVTLRAGLHRTGVRRYFASKEELLLELAEREWARWRDAIRDTLADSGRLRAADVADVVAETIISRPIFCDLLTHVTLSLEGAVDIERARRYKTNAFAAHNDIVFALAQTSSMSEQQLQSLLAATVLLAAGLWQVSHPNATLVQLYKQVPEWEHIALNFGPRLRSLVRATAVGLVESP